MLKGSRKNRRVVVSVEGFGLYKVEVPHGMQVKNAYAQLPNQQYVSLNWEQKRLVGIPVASNAIGGKVPLKVVPASYTLPAYAH